MKKSSVSLILIGEGDETERKADQFASYFLIFPSSLYRMVEEIRENANRTHLEVEDIIKLGQFYGISHKAMLYRLRNDGYLDAEEIKNMDISVIETASRLGYDTSLYRPLSESKKEMVLGHYIKSTEQLLEKLYSGKIVIPQEVYDEINIPTIPHLKSRIDQLVTKGSAEIVSIDIGTEEYALYRDLTRNHDSNKIIGKGEATSIFLAKKHNGILGSNNLRDVKPYVEEFSLEHMTTGDILIEAFKA